MPNRGFLTRIALLLTCAVCAFCLPGCQGNSQSNPQGEESTQATTTTPLKESPQEGYLAPGFTVPDLTGKMVSLSDFRGKVVLVNIWATWCGPCRMEVPSLDRLYQLRRDREFEILAVSVDRSSSSRVGEFVARYQMSFPVVHDSRGQVGRKYWARNVPSSFLVDKRGVIRWKVIGARQWDDAYVLSKIDQLLSE